MDSHTTSKRQAFTLVELLVVIGIIAIMIAILLPALKKVKEAGNSIKCQANIRQIMTAVMMYTSENRNSLPVPPSIGNFTTNSNSLMYYMSTTAPSGAGVIRYDAGALWKYLAPGHSPADPNAAEPATAISQPRILRAVFNCPTEDEEQFRPVYWGAMRIDSGFVRNFSYSWNRQIRLPYTNSSGPAGVQPACTKINKIKNPANKILLMEELAPNDGMCYMLNDGGINTDDEPAFRHNGKGNYGFADGHVASMAPKQLGFKAPVVKNGYQHTAYDNTNLIVQHFLLTK